MCDGISRRSFLQVGSLGLGGLSLPQLLQANDLSNDKGSRDRRHKSVIMVFLPGGPSHLDIWDIKPNAPVEIRGEFKPIQTSLPGFQICEHMPKLAQRMEKFTIIRSLVGAINEHASEICYSGWSYRDSQIRNQPCMGSAISHLQGSANRAIPPFISMTHPTPNRWTDPGRAGFVGPAHKPFRPSDEGKADLTLSMSRERLQDRGQLLKSIDQIQHNLDASGEINSVDAYTRQALELLTSNQLLNALDIEKEDQRTRERYGIGTLDPVDDGAPMHNQDFLIARRLVEAGARCVSISFGRWDTHSCRKAGDLAYKNNFMQLREYLPRLEQCLIALVDDLEERGMLDDVSIVAWGEMGRTPRVNANGGRDHWPAVSGCFLAGGGMNTGQVLGTTTRLAEEAKDRPIHYQEVFATLYRQIGIDVSNIKIPDFNGRPQYLLQHRDPISELI